MNIHAAAMLCLVAQLCLTLCDPTDCSPPGSSVHGVLQARILEWVAMSSSGDLSNPGIKPRSPTLQADSLPTEPPGKPNNTGVGSLSLLHWIFPTLELNQGLLHCRQILYHLSYQGSPCEYLYEIPIQGKQIYSGTKQTCGCPERRRRREGEEQLIAKSMRNFMGNGNALYLN